LRRIDDQRQLRIGPVIVRIIFHGERRAVLCVNDGHRVSS
jgi:hypothetical protein